MATRTEDRYILVNIPAFQLEAVDSYEVQQRHRVIVGRTERPSPSVKATVRALNFYPYWRVPESVAHLDLIPRLRQGAGLSARREDPRLHQRRRPGGRSDDGRLGITGGRRS